MTWEEEPPRLIASLQTLVSSQSATAEPPAPSTLEDVIGRLKSPRRFSTR